MALLQPDDELLAVVGRGKVSPRPDPGNGVEDPLEGSAPSGRRWQIPPRSFRSAPRSKRRDRRGFPPSPPRRLAIAVEQPPFRGSQPRQDAVRRRPGRLQIPGLAQDPGRPGQGGDHQAVPVRQDLVVPLRADAFRRGRPGAGGGPSPGAAGTPLRISSCPAAILPGGGKVENVVPVRFPVTGSTKFPSSASPKTAAAKRASSGPRSPDLGHPPEVEPPLFSLAVGILGGVESPFRRPQIAQGRRR